MASETAKALAQDIIKARQRGGKIILREMAEKRGYSETVKKSPSKVTRTQSFQKEIKPFLTRLIGLRDKVATEMESKDITQERFTELSRSLRDFNHDIQLLSGGVTEREEIVPLYDYTIRNNNSIREDKDTEETN